MGKKLRIGRGHLIISFINGVIAMGFMMTSYWYVGIWIIFWQLWLIIYDVYEHNNA